MESIISLTYFVNTPRYSAFGKDRVELELDGRVCHRWAEWEIPQAIIDLQLFDIDDVETAVAELKRDGRKFRCATEEECNQLRSRFQPLGIE
jgi:hypothetical protein